MKNILIIICLIFSIQGYSQLGTTLSKPVPEKEFQEIKSILSAVNQSAFRLEMNVIGANGAIRKEVLGMKNLAGLQKDATGKNFMVNNSGAIGSLRSGMPEGNSTIPSDPSKINQGQQNRNNDASTFTQFGQTGSQGSNRPSGFGGTGQSRPGTMGKSDGGSAPDKGDKSHTNTSGGSGDRTHNNTSTTGHNNTPPVPANANNYSRSENDDAKKPEPSKNTGGSTSQNTSSNNIGANTWSGNTSGGSGSRTNTGAGANTWTGAGNTTTTGGSGEEEKKKREMSSVSNPGPNNVSSQSNPGTQRFSANQTISFPPNFRQGSFFICDLCSVNLIGQPAMNRLESILTKYK